MREFEGKYELEYDFPQYSDDYIEEAVCDICDEVINDLEVIATNRSDSGLLTFSVSVVDKNYYYLVFVSTRDDKYTITKILRVRF